MKNTYKPATLAKWKTDYANRKGSAQDAYKQAVKEGYKGKFESYKKTIAAKKADSKISKATKTTKKSGIEIYVDEDGKFLHLTVDGIQLIKGEFDIYQARWTMKKL